jgi:hypothetical protein
VSSALLGRPFADYGVAVAVRRYVPCRLKEPREILESLSQATVAKKGETERERRRLSDPSVLRNLRNLVDGVGARVSKLLGFRPQASRAAWRHAVRQSYTI